MRNLTFKRFLTESETPTMAEIRARLGRECAQFMAQAHGLPAYRGINGVDDPWGQELHPHPNGRFPLSSSNGFVTMFDSMAELGLEEKRIRSHTMFMSGHARSARVYGKLHYVFPKGDLKCIWGPQIKDSYINDTFMHQAIGDSITSGLRRDDVRVELSPSDIETFFLMMDKRFGSDWMHHVDVEKNCRDILVATLADGSPTTRTRIPPSVKIFPIVRAALHKTFNLLYPPGTLLGGLESGSEILVYESRGYYALPVVSVIEAWHSETAGEELDDEVAAGWVMDDERLLSAYKWFMNLGEK